MGGLGLFYLPRKEVCFRTPYLDPHSKIGGLNFQIVFTPGMPSGLAWASFQRAFTRCLRDHYDSIIARWKFADARSAYGVGSESAGQQRYSCALSSSSI